MLDQMFTAENFRRIYDAENRKGLDLANRYFPSLEPLTLAVRTKVQDIRDHRTASGAHARISRTTSRALQVTTVRSAVLAPQCWPWSVPPQSTGAV